jgi:HSP20 family protein
MAESKGSASAQQQKRQEERQEQSSRPGGQELQTRGPRSGERGLERRGAFPELFAASPFGLMRRMSEEMDRMFDRMFEDFGFGRRSLAPRGFFREPASARGAIWSPQIEAFEKEDKFIVRAELPGLKKDDIEVNVTEDALTIQGQRRHEQEEQREGFYHSERSYGSFYRAIPLPDGVITDSAEASFRDGVLEVRLQSAPGEVSRGRKLEITGGSDQGQRK